MRRVALATLMAVSFFLFGVVAVSVAQAAAEAGDPPPGTVSGVVTDSAAQPIGSVGVGAWRLVTQWGMTYWSLEETTATDANGNYSLSLPPGSWRLGFGAHYYGNTAWVPEFYDGVSRVEDAQDVAVTAGSENPGFDASLTPRGSLAGTLAQPDGQLAAGVTVCGQPTQGNPSTTTRCTDTDEQGRYRLYLDAGTYHLRFGDPSYGSWVDEFYPNKPGTAGADEFTLSGNDHLTGVDSQVVARGSISGTLTSSTGGPAAYAPVCAENAAGSRSFCTSSDWSGRFEVFVNDGDWRLRFGNASYGDWAQEYFDDQFNAADSELVSVSGSQARTGFDAELRKRGTITGTLTDDTGAAISNASVCVYPASNQFEGRCTTSSGADGTYVIPVDAGQYKLRFSGDQVGGGAFVEEWFDGQTTFAQASSVDVAWGQEAAGINAQLAARPAIHGTVTDFDEKPIANTSVCSFVQTNGSWNSDTCAYTGADGTYRLYADQGTNRIGFSTNTYMDLWSRQFYDGAANVNEATDVVLGESDVDGIDARLNPLGTISGDVTLAGGIAAAQVSVCAHQATDWGWWSQKCVQTDGAGQYTIALEDGTWRLGFSGEGVVTEYYDEKGSVANAHNIVVDQGVKLTGFDAELARLGSIGGTITGDGSPAMGVDVCALTKATLEGESEWQTRGCAQSDHQGAYQINVPAGVYRLQFSSDDFMPDEWASEYWDDATTLATATDVAVAGDEDVTDIDADLARLAIISGTVTGVGDAGPLGQISVCAYPVVAGNSAGFSTCKTTDVDGTYRLPVEDGTYKVGFVPSSSGFPFPSPSKWATEYYDDQLSREQAADVVVSGGVDVPDISAELGRNRSISGTLSGPDGNPVSTGFVSAQSTTGAGSVAFTDSNGRYELFVAPGSYTVAFGTFATLMVDEYYNDKPSSSSAELVDVSTADATGIDAALEVPGTVAGSVTMANSASLDGVEVCAYAQSSDDKVKCDWSENAADFSLNLKPGTYRLKAIGTDASGDDTVEWFDNKSSFAAATPVVVESDQTATADFLLGSANEEPTGTLAGDLRNATGNPLDGARVTACDSEGAGCWTRRSDDEGRFTFQLPAGSYAVSGYPVEADDGTPVQESGVLVTVEATTTRTLQLGAVPQPPGQDVTIGDQVGDDSSVPRVIVGQSFPLEITACAGATSATYSFTVGTSSSSGTLTEGPAGVYKATVAGARGTGSGAITFAIDCPQGPDVDESVAIYIDPSGHVRDEDGDPISGATVELFRSDTPKGEFTPVPDGSDIMSPSNRANPDISSGDGHFGWDVIAGYYQVRVSKDGCVAPGSDEPVLRSRIMEIPPPVTDLDLRLRCDGAGGAVAPAPPNNPQAIKGEKSATVSWAQPVVTGGSDVTEYQVRAVDVPAKGCATDGALTCTVGGLTPGVAYRFVVTATNGAGLTSPESVPTDAVVPTDSPSGTPSSPTPVPTTSPTQPSPTQPTPTQPTLTQTPSPGGESTPPSGGGGGTPGPDTTGPRALAVSKVSGWKSKTSAKRGKAVVRVTVSPANGRTATLQKQVCSTKKLGKRKRTVCAWKSVKIVRFGGVPSGSSRISLTTERQGAASYRLVLPATDTAQGITTSVMKVKHKR